MGTASAHAQVRPMGKILQQCAKELVAQALLMEPFALLFALMAIMGTILFVAKPARVELRPTPPTYV